MADPHRLGVDGARCAEAGGYTIEDPGASGTIRVDRSPAICQLTVGASNETRSLAAPGASGMALIVVLNQTTGGNATVDGTAVLNTEGELVQFASSLVNGSLDWIQLGGAGGGGVGLVDIDGLADGLVLDADGDTTISAPTDDQIDIELASVDHVVLKKVATADAGTTTNIAEIAFTSPVDTAGTNTHSALNIDIEIGNATGGANLVSGVSIDGITGDAQVVERGIVVGSGWACGVGVNDDSTVEFGAGASNVGDAAVLWSTGDADNHSLVVALGDTNQALHVTDLGAKATDWNVAAGTHPTVYVHSNTTPATDYTAYGPHDGSDAVVWNVVGATGARFQIDSVGVLEIDDAAITSFTAATDTAGKDVFIETQDGGGTPTAARTGGAYSVKMGDGSATANAVAAGAGGAATLQAGDGGANSGGATGQVGGAGGGVIIQSGAGGTTNSTGAHASGNGGAAQLIAGAAGTSTGATATKAGNGGSVAVTAGAGGTATAGTAPGGDGGNITLTPGTGGTSVGGVAGDPGKVKIATGCLHFTNAQTIDMADAQVTLTLNPGTPTGTTITSNMLFVDANSGGTEDLLLPPEADCNGLFLMVVNTGGEDIIVKEDSDTTTIATVSTAESAIFTCNGTSWGGGVVKAT